MEHEQLRFGPPPMQALSVTITRHKGGWTVVGRVLREGAGWSPAEQTTYADLSWEEAQELGAQLVWNPPPL